MKPKIDLAAALIDFASEFHTNPEAAVDTLLSLLVDPFACQARLAMLEELEPPGDRSPSKLKATFDSSHLDRVV